MKMRVITTSAPAGAGIVELPPVVSPVRLIAGHCVILAGATDVQFALECGMILDGVFASLVSAGHSAQVPFGQSFSVDWGIGLALMSNATLASMTVPLWDDLVIGPEHRVRILTDGVVASITALRFVVLDL